MPYNPKNFVPGEVRLDQARHKARRAFGRHRIVVNQGASEAYRRNIARVDFSDAPWRRNERSDRDTAQPSRRGPR